MKYIMTMRELGENDLRAECPFLNEKEQYEMYLDALVEDIFNLSVVSNASRVDNKIIIETTDSAYKDLSEAMKPFVGGERCCQYRVVALSPFK